MAGPDSKRLYLSIVAQNLDQIKSERAYWNKNFVPVTPSGAGTKYTTLQAAMLLKKMQVVKFLARHPATDITVKATDGRTTLMIAAQSNMPVSVLQKVLEKYDLKTINECDPMGKTALDLAEPGSETYQFLKSVGCQTKAARDACLQGFFVSAGKNVVHQRVRRKSDAGDGKSSSCPPAESDRVPSEKQDAPRSWSEGNSGPEESCSDGDGGSVKGSDDRSAVDVGADTMEEESPWQLFNDPEDLLRVLQNYVDTWGDEGEEGELCLEWIAYLKKKMKKNAASAAVTKWNNLVVSLYGKENISEYKGQKNGSGAVELGRRGTGEEGETGHGEEATVSSKESSSDNRQKKNRERGPESDRTKRANNVGNESANKGGSCLTGRKGEKERCESAPHLGKKDGEEAAGGGAKVEEVAGEPETTESDTPVARSMTVPESLRGFFNPQSLTEANIDSTQQKPAPEGDRRRTLCVCIDKVDARERFAEVLPSGGSGGSRRRHKKDSKD